VSVKHQRLGPSGYVDDVDLFVIVGNRDALAFGVPGANPAGRARQFLEHLAGLHIEKDDASGSSACHARAAGVEHNGGEHGRLPLLHSPVAVEVA